MSSGHPPSLVEASADVRRCFAIDVDSRSLADAIDAHGIYDEMATREKIDRHYRKVLDRHKSSGTERVQSIAAGIQALETAPDLRRGLYIGEGFVLSKKYGLGREQSQSLGMEKDAPPLPPKRGFISTQQLGSGSRSPHFNRRSVSRSRVRSELTGDTPYNPSTFYSPAPTQTTGSPLSTVTSTRPFGSSSFNAAVAARDAMAKMNIRPRLDMGGAETTSPPPMVERPRARAATTTLTPTVYDTPSSSATNRLYDEQLRHSSSSSPVSLSTATPSTVVHVQHGGGQPQRATAALRATAGVCGRAAGANEVADEVLAQGLARALKGFESSYFRLSDGVFRMSAGCAVAGTRRGRLLRVLQTASHAHSANMATSQGADLMTEAFIVGLQKVHREFTQDVMTLERERGSYLDTRALDFRIRSRWEAAMARVAALAALVRRPQMRGMTLLHELYIHYTGLENTGGMEERVIITLLDSVMFVFANLLQQWLLDGTLNVHNTEFLIKEREGHGAEQSEAAMVKSWQTRFNLDKALVPAFLDRNLPKMILSVGKCARLLATDNVYDELSAHRAKVAALDLSRLYQLDYNERTAVAKELHAIEKSICGLVVERLLQRDQLKEHLRAIRHVFLCLDERYATHLFESIEMMCRDVQSVSATRTQHAASLAFIAAARTAALAFPFKLPVDAVVKESVSSASTPVSSARGAALRSGRGSGSGVASASGASRARVTVTPTYTAPRLAAIVLGRGVIEHYQTLFHSIWPVYSTRLALSEARNELLFISDASRRLGKGTSASLRAFQLSMATAGAFFDNLIRYFIQGIAMHSSQLTARLDRAGKVEECDKAHLKFLLQMADHVGTMLTGDKRPPAMRNEKQLSAIQTARSVLLDEASDLLDLFWTWVAEAEREQLLRKQKSDEMELGADAQSTTLHEFERLEENFRREEAEKHQVASATKIMAIFDRFSLQMGQFIDLYETDGKRVELAKLLLAMKPKRRGEKDVQQTKERTLSAKWSTLAQA